MSLNFENVTMSLNFKKDNIHFTNKGLKIENNAKEASYDYLPFQSLKTIFKKSDLARIRFGQCCLLY